MRRLQQHEYFLFFCSHTHTHAHTHTHTHTNGTAIGSNLELSILPKDTSICRPEESGIELPTFWLVDEPLHLLNYGSQSKQLRCKQGVCSELVYIWDYFGRDEDKVSIEKLQNFQIVIDDSKSVPLKNLAEIVVGIGPKDIERANAVRIVDIRASVTGDYQKNVVGAVENIIKEINKHIFMPVGTSLEFKGAYQNAQENMMHTMMSILLSIFIVYALMAALFESFIAPLVIMVSVPFGLFGSLATLLLTNQSMNNYSTLGMIVLVGIVINNGIVLVDYMNHLLARGDNLRDAILQGGIRRFRPVCMTTFTTILGMLPTALGLGEGGELYSPFAISVIGGLFVSTFFTLFVVPMLYEMIRKRFPYKSRLS